MKRSSAVLSAAALVFVSSIANAMRPPQVEAEAGDTNQKREEYMTLRRVNPYDSTFDAAAARYKAYQQFQSVLAADRANPVVQRQLYAPLHAEAWQALGPATILGGQTPTSATAASRSAVSGRVNALAIDAIDGAVYAGGAQGGLWRSYDHGVTWTALTDSLGSLAIGSIAIAPGSHPLNQATIYIGTGEGNFSGDSYAGVGIYKSTDSGRTWQGPLGATQFANRSVGTIVVDSQNPQVVLAGSTLGLAGISGTINPSVPQRAIYRSTDGGNTWARVLPTTTATLRISRIIQDPQPGQTAGNTIYWAATTPNASASSGGLWKSTNSGATWTRVDGTAPGLPAIGTTSFTRTWVTATYDATLAKTVLYYAISDVPATSVTGDGGMLYRSLDGGATWVYQPAADGFCQGQCTYDMPVYVEPGNSLNVYTAGAGTSGSLPSSFMLSTNGGTTFTDEMVAVDGKSALHADTHDITSWPGSPNEVWVADDGGVFYSTDRGQHWVDVNTNLAVTQFQYCDLHPTDPNQAYGGTQDNGTESYLGNIPGPVVGTTAWSHSDDGDGGFALIDQSAPTNVTHTYFNASNYLIGAALAINGPASQPADYLYFAGEIPGYITSGMNPADNVLFYAPMHLDRSNPTTLYFGTQSLYIANDYFNQTVIQENALSGAPPYTVSLFTQIGAATDFTVTLTPAQFPGVISAIETVPSVTGQNSSTIFVGSDNGVVWRSTDSGATFNVVDSSVAQYVSQIAVDPRNSQIVAQARADFTGSVPAHNVRISIDGGTTWNDASNGLPDIPVNTLIWDPSFPGTIWAGTDIGTYLSADKGATWHPYSNGMPNVAVYSLAANRSTHTILACTHGRGAFRLNLDAIFIDGFEGY